MLRKIHLYGVLAKKFGKMIELDVETAAEAVRALCINFPTFRKEFEAGSWHVVRGKTIDDGLDLDIDGARAFNLGRGELHFAPYIAGSKRGGLMKIILGVALVGVALFMGMGTPLLGGLGMGATYGNVAMIGAGLALAGVSEFLSPSEDDEKENDSFIMTGPGNSYEQGGPIPLIYGRVITGTIMVSGAIDIEDIIEEEDV